MTIEAIVETVVAPAANLSDLSVDVDVLASLQREAAAIEKQQRTLRARIRKAMVARNVDAFVSAGGHRATLFVTTRSEFDREAATRLLSPAVLGELLNHVSSVTLRVK